jgi:hypothetical protein
VSDPRNGGALDRKRNLRSSHVKQAVPSFLHPDRCSSLPPADAHAVDSDAAAGDDQSLTWKVAALTG